MKSRRRTMSNQRWNNVVYVTVEIYNVEQGLIDLVYFNIDINNVRQCRNNVVIFNVEFHNVDQRWNNVVNMAVLKNLKVKKNIFELQKKMTHLINSTCLWRDQLKRKGNMQRTM